MRSEVADVVYWVFVLVVVGVSSFILGRLTNTAPLVAQIQKAIREGDTEVNKALEKLAAKVNRSTEVSESAIALIKGLSAQIRERANDPAAIEALAAELEESSAKLAQALVENTPADPNTPGPTPEPPPTPTPDPET